MAKERIAYIDTAKGLLILCLLFGHLRLIARMEGLDDSVLHLMSGAFGFYTPFFMQTFFLITGFCSTFRTGFGTFLLKNLKTLILPAVLLDLLGYAILAAVGAAGEPFTAHLTSFASWLTTGGPWFIIALFWAKLLFWALSRLPRTWQVLLAVGVLYLLGLVLDRFGWIQNYQWHRHVLLGLPYLAAGYFLKGHAEKIQPYLKPVGLIWLPLILLQNVLAHFTSFTIPAQDLDIHVTLASFPLHFLNVAGGSALTVFLARMLTKSKTLALLGQGSLLAYLMNYPIQVLVLRLILPLYPAGSLPGCFLFHAAAYALCIALTCVLIRLIYSHRALSWLVGKF